MGNLFCCTTSPQPQPEAARRQGRKKPATPPSQTRSQEPSPTTARANPKPRARNKAKPNPYAPRGGAAAASASTVRVLDGVVPHHPRLRVTDKYHMGRELGRGEFGVTRLATDRGPARERLACKSIPKARLRTAVDVADVRREVAIMASLPEHPALVRMRAAYEDDDAVHILMELCDGGELFDRIVADGTRSAPRPGSWRRSCARCRGGQDERQRRGVGDAIAQVGHSERQEQGGHDVVVHLDVAATGRATRMAPRASSGWSARRASAFMSPLCKSPRFHVWTFGFLLLSIWCFC